MATESVIHDIQLLLKVLRVSMLMVLIVALQDLVSHTIGMTESRTACASPGDLLTFECTSFGGIATVWRGSAFNCGHRFNEIVLRHSIFPSRARGSCNSGQILAQSVDVVNNTYFISQLNVNVSSDMHNKTIECEKDDVISSVILSSTTIFITSVIEGSRITNIHLASVSHGGNLLFKWSNTQSIMYPTDYVILSNCGTCPLFTSNTSAMCKTDLMGHVCMFSVLARVRDRIFGNPRPQFVAVMLRVPDPPELRVELVENFKVYSTFNMSQAYNISDGIDGSPISYTITYNDSTSGALCFSDTIPSSLCEQGICSHTLDTWMLSYRCSGRGSIYINITVSVYATNILGEGPLSDPITVTIYSGLRNPVQDGGSSSYSFIIVVIPSIALILCMAAATLCTVIVVVKVRRKRKVQRERNENTAATAAAVTYEEIGELQHSSRIDTSKNVAYCHVKELKSRK